LVCHAVDFLIGDGNETEKHLAKLQRLSKKMRDFSIAAYGKAAQDRNIVFDLAMRKRWNLADQMLSKGGLTFINDTFVEAARLGRLDVIEHITTTPALVEKLTQDNVISAFGKAANQGHLPVVQYFVTTSILANHLMPNKNIIKINWAFIDAVCKGHLLVVQYFVTTPILANRLMPYRINWAFACAAGQGHLPVIQSFITTRVLANELTPDTINDAFKFAVRKENLPIVQYFVTTPTLYNQLTYQTIWDVIKNYPNCRTTIIKAAIHNHAYPILAVSAAVVGVSIYALYQMYGS
jgi:hypothetical protein